MTPIIQLKDINKRVQDGTKFLQILKDCSITIQQGEMVAILGRSGAGKTTLLNLMAMLDNDYQGMRMLKQTQSVFHFEQNSSATFFRIFN